MLSLMLANMEQAGPTTQLTATGQYAFLGQTDLRSSHQAAYISYYYNENINTDHHRNDHHNHNQHQNQQLQSHQQSYLLQAEPTTTSGCAVNEPTLELNKFNHPVSELSEQQQQCDPIQLHWSSSSTSTNHHHLNSSSSPNLNLQQGASSGLLDYDHQVMPASVQSVVMNNNNNFLELSPQVNQPGGGGGGGDQSYASSNHDCNYGHHHYLYNRTGWQPTQVTSATATADNYNYVCYGTHQPIHQHHYQASSLSHSHQLNIKQEKENNSNRYYHHDGRSSLAPESDAILYHQQASWQTHQTHISQQVDDVSLSLIDGIRNESPSDLLLASSHDLKRESASQEMATTIWPSVDGIEAARVSNDAMHQFDGQANFQSSNLICRTWRQQQHLESKQIGEQEFVAASKPAALMKTGQTMDPITDETIKHSSAISSEEGVELLANSRRKNQCHVCGRNYARPSTLKTHLRTHTNERPFKCNVCLKTFSQAANLTAHQRVHTGERPFSCPICGRQFSQSSSVITHLRTHSGERPYRCTYCERTFSDSSTLTKHCRIHSGEKPYQCEYCPLNFSQSGNLSRHLKLHLSNNGSAPSSSSSVGAGAAAAATNTTTTNKTSLNCNNDSSSSNGSPSSSSSSSSLVYSSYQDIRQTAINGIQCRASAVPPLTSIA